MTEGGIASWKVKEGDSFAPGDVLLEIVRPRPRLVSVSLLGSKAPLKLRLC